MDRVINSLDIEWKPFTEEWQNKNIYTQLQQAPFLNLYFLNCSVSFIYIYIYIYIYNIIYLLLKKKKKLKFLLCMVY